MLVLTRRIGEEIIIGDNIRVTLVDIRGQYVRLGFTAPDNVRIHRSELREPLPQVTVTIKVRPESDLASEEGEPSDAAHNRDAAG